MPAKINKNKGLIRQCQCSYFNDVYIPGPQEGVPAPGDLQAPGPGCARWGSSPRHSPP